MHVCNKSMKYLEISFAFMQKNILNMFLGLNDAHNVIWWEFMNISLNLLRNYDAWSPVVS